MDGDTKNVAISWSVVQLASKVVAMDGGGDAVLTVDGDGH